MSRGALLSSAVSFLRDPSTASSPLAQRIAFLESKGLTPPEIEQALATASGNAPGPQYGGARVQEFERDWRDWFIMGVIGGTVGYVAVKLAQVSPLVVGWKGVSYARRARCRETGRRRAAVTRRARSRTVCSRRGTTG